MKRHTFVLSLLIAISMVVSAASFGYAGDLMVSGYGDITLDIIDDAKDNLCSSPSSATLNTNCDELQFLASAEINFERTQGPVTARLDLDFPVTAGIGTGNNIAAIIVEQIKFDLAIPNAPAGLNLTAGIFNSPIGFEAQDAIDKLQTSNGQLFALTTSNLAGIYLSGGNEMVNAGFIFANDWNTPVPNVVGGIGEEHSLGLTLSVMLMPEANLSIGYLDSGVLPTEGLIDVIISGTVMPSPDLSLLYAFEYLGDEVNTGMGLTLHAKHGKHGLTLRYDQVEVDPGGGVAKTTPTSLTFAAICNMIDSLTIVLEWKSTDPDTAASATDTLGLEFVTTF